MPSGTFNLKDILGSNIRLDGTLSVSGTTTLGGAATLKDSLSVAGGAHFAADTNTSNVYVGGTLSVSGLTTIGGHIIPSTNDTFDIGSPEFKIRDLYISDNSLWIGDETKISFTGGKMKFRKRKKNVVPQAIIDAAALAGHSSSDVTRLAALASAGVSSIDQMKLHHWQKYMREFKKSAVITDIFRDVDDDYEETTASDGWKEISDTKMYTTTHVGIGMDNPGSKLDVNGDINISSGSSYKINGNTAQFLAAISSVSLDAAVGGTPGVILGGTSTAASLAFTIPQGIAGAVGATGAKGNTGTAGGAGAPGATGAKGDTGAPGAAGAKGTTGNPGAAGAAGAAGAKGPTGNPGAAGAKGPTGNPGAAGATGAKGDTGNTGGAGATGAKGDTGPSGGTGPQGVAGPSGPRGATGPKGSGRSDDRIKYHEEEIKNPLELIKQLTPYKYEKISEEPNKSYGNWIPKDDEWDSVKHKYEWATEAGLIAQHVRRIPELAYMVNGEESTMRVTRLTIQEHENLAEDRKVDFTPFYGKEEVIDGYEHREGKQILTVDEYNGLELEKKNEYDAIMIEKEVLMDYFVECETETILTLDYNGIHCVSIGAIQGLDARLEIKKKKNEDLKSLVETLMARIARLNERA